MKKTLWILPAVGIAALAYWRHGAFGPTEPEAGAPTGALRAEPAAAPGSDPASAPPEAAPPRAGGSTAAPAKAPVAAANFVEAYEKCPMGVRCRVAGDAWSEYLSIRENDPDGPGKFAILNFLVTHLDDPRNRNPARKIILEEFQPHSLMRYWYLGKYLHGTGEDAEARTTYDAFRVEFKDRPDQIPWLDVGNFYYDIREYRTALECYTRELDIQGKRPDAREVFEKESTDYLERRISELRRRLER